MITKENVTELKNGSTKLLEESLSQKNDPSKIYFVLSNLGRLPNDFDSTCFIPLLNHKYDKIRLLAVKNLGKVHNEDVISILDKVSENDANTMIRREAVSSIGRMRSYKSIPILVKKLADTDPKIVLQAIRALLVFKSAPDVQNELMKLRKHPNELIQEVIKKEYFPSVQSNLPHDKHVLSPDILKNLVVHGDVLEIMKQIKQPAIHLTFTSPPYYNARDYSIYQSYKEYLSFLQKVFQEVYRITKEGRFLVLNTSPIIIPRVSRQHSSKRYPIPFDIHPLLIEMGWEFIDDIVWVKPEASAKNRNAGFLQHRKPLAYKPNAISEYLMVYRKSTDKLIDWNIHQYDWDTVQRSKVKNGYETSNVWHVDPTFDKKHSAVFPSELCERVIRYYSYEGDLVFDPFAGSGTMGKASSLLSRYFLLAEISSEYVKRIRDNISPDLLNQNEKKISFQTLKQFTNNMENYYDVN